MIRIGSEFRGCRDPIMFLRKPCVETPLSASSPCLSRQPRLRFDLAMAPPEAH